MSLWRTGRLTMRLAVVEENLGPLQLGDAGVGTLDDVTVATAVTTAAEGACGAHLGLFVKHGCQKCQLSTKVDSTSRLGLVRCRDRCSMKWEEECAGSKRVELRGQVAVQHDDGGAGHHTTFDVYWRRDVHMQKVPG
jgi:hypothetical protein